MSKTKVEALKRLYTSITGNTCSGDTVVDIVDDLARYYETVATPTASPVAGAVASGTTVTLTSATDGAAIYYTVDGSTPTDTSSVYSTPISITEGVTIKAIAVKTGKTNSDVMTAVYTIE